MPINIYLLINYIFSVFYLKSSISYKTTYRYELNIYEILKFKNKMQFFKYFSDNLTKKEHEEF